MISSKYRKNLRNAKIFPNPRLMRFLISLGLFIQLLSVSAQSENFNFSKLNTYNGVSNNQVNAILKDSEGFLWFGTLSGLNRYDGYSIKIFRKKPGDSSSRV